MLDKTLPMRPISKRMRAFIYQCKDLPPSDDDGLSDPYVKLWTKNNTAVQTKTV
jgi:Ca2+-dependent lipid-binding protein